MDALSELLRVVKLSGAVFINARCSSPWGVHTPPSSVFSPYTEFPSNHIIEFHLVTEGRCFIRVGSETTPLSPGDIAMVPHGDAHYMGNGIVSAPADGAAMLPALLGAKFDITHLGGGGEETRLICGYLSCDPRLIQPVLAGLPRLVRVNIRDDAGGTLLENMFLHAVQQVVEAAPGSQIIVARLAEALFAEALRRYLLQLPSGRNGWLAGAADPGIGRALAALHRKPSHPWTLEELAQEAGVSRSTLTEKFARYLDQGPMTYLAEWRLELAAESLRTTSRSVLQIAEEVGYESEAAFNRAFKRRFEVPPARYRKNWKTQTNITAA
jgi:AraC-like DNA-binding protein